MTAFELAAVIGSRLDEDGLDYAIGGALALTVRAWVARLPTSEHKLLILADLERRFRPTGP